MAAGTPLRGDQTDNRRNAGNVTRLMHNLLTTNRMIRFSSIERFAVQLQARRRTGASMILRSPCSGIVVISLLSQAQHRSPPIHSTLILTAVPTGKSPGMPMVGQTITELNRMSLDSWIAAIEIGIMPATIASRDRPFNDCAVCERYVVSDLECYILNGVRDVDGIATELCVNHA